MNGGFKEKPASADLDTVRHCCVDVSVGFMSQGDKRIFDGGPNPSVGWAGWAPIWDACEEIFQESQPFVLCVVRLVRRGPLEFQPEIPSIDLVTKQARTTTPTTITMRLRA